MLTVRNFDDYQVEATKFCTENPRSYLSMDMGLGKTIVALTTVALWLKRKQTKAVLYVAPINICLTVVAQEAALWKHTWKLKFVFLNGKNKDDLLLEPADVYLINPEGLKWLHTTLYRRLRHKNPSFPFDSLVIDEGTKFKGRGVTWRKLKGMYPIFSKSMVMSGRPAPNALLDLWAQYYLLDKGERLSKNYTTFRKTHFYPDFRGFTWILKDGHEKEIYDLIEDITYTVDPELADLPEIRVRDVYCKLSTVQLKQYKRFQKQKILELENTVIKVKNSMAMTMKLRQFCQGLIYDQDNTVPIHDIKYRALLDLIESSNGKPLMIIYNFNHERDFLLKAIKGSRYIGGGLTKEQRVKEINDWNAGKTKELLVHPKSVSHGLNMQFGGHRIVFYSPTWSSDEYHQIIARLRRKGQSRGYVIVFRLIVESTIDKIMFTSVDKKTGVHVDMIESLLEYAHGS